MSEQGNRLLELVSELEQELSKPSQLSSNERGALAESLTELRGRLNDPNASTDSQVSHSEPGDLGNRLNDWVERLEGDHPTLAAALTRVVASLGQMGI